CFFFFQAEDGIRDLTVTGVQTCALPICRGDHRIAPARHVAADRADGNMLVPEHDARQRLDLELAHRLLLLAREVAHLLLRKLDRSEERRVGKECRSRWSP